MLGQQQVFGAAIAELLAEEGMDGRPPPVPNEGTGDEAEAVTGIAQPPAEIHVVACGVELRIKAADGVDGASRADDEADDRTPAVPGVARMRRTLLVGFAVTVIAVGVTAQLAIGGSDTDQSGIAAICRGVTSAPDDSGEALRDAFAGCSACCRTGRR